MVHRYLNRAAVALIGNPPLRSVHPLCMMGLGPQLSPGRCHLFVRRIPPTPITVSIESRSPMAVLALVLVTSICRR